MAFLGSNIYQLLALKDYYFYEQSIQYQADFNHIKWNDFIVTPEKHDHISAYLRRTSKDLNEFEFKELFLSIFVKAFEVFDYPFFTENVLYNPYEIDPLTRETHVVEIGTTIYENQMIGLFVNPHKLKCSKLDGAEKTKKYIQRKKALENLRGRLLKNNLGLPKQLKLVKIHQADQLVGVDVQQLKNTFELKFKMVINNENFIFETNHKSKYKYLFAEHCQTYSKEKIVYADSIEFASKLAQWNQLFSQNQEFIKYLKQFNVLLTAKAQLFKNQIIEPGNFYFAEKQQRSINNIAMSRTGEDFQKYYQDIFLDDRVAFSTNLLVDNWIILINEDSSAYQTEQYNRFLSQFESICKKRSYQFKQPTVIQFKSTDSLENLLKRLTLTQVKLVLMFGDRKILEGYYQGLKHHLFALAIPFQSIWVPCHIPRIVRIIAKVAGQIGSSPWSLNEITGKFLTFKVSCVGGLSVQKDNKFYTISFVLSINKTLSKFTSTFEITENQSEGIKKCFKDCLSVFNKSQKVLPDFICILHEPSTNHSKEEIYELLNEAQEELEQQFKIQAQSFTKAFITTVEVDQTKKIRLFGQPDDEFQPLSTSNLTIGSHVKLSQNRYLVALQRESIAVPYMTILEIKTPSNHQVKYLEQEITKFVYRLQYLNCQLDFRTYLPTPLQYAFQLSRCLTKEVYNQSDVAKVAMMSGKLFYI